MTKVCKVERPGEGNGDTGSAGDKKSVSAKNNDKVSILIHFKFLGGFNDIRLKKKKITKEGFIDSPFKAQGDEDCSWELVTNKSKRKSKSSPDNPNQSRYHGTFD